MNTGITIGVSIEWEKEQTDLSNCRMCEETIYGVMHSLYVVVSKGTEQESRSRVKDIRVCESCYQTIKDENKD